MGFRGFPPEAIAFYEGLEADNSKAYWEANKATYLESVRGPMEALLDEVAELGPFHLFRPYRDVRFSKDKSPYKTGIAAVSEREGGASYYVQLSSAGLVAGAGYYQMVADQLSRFRSAVDDDESGSSLERLVGELERKGYSLGAVGELRSAPRGVPKDHPRIALLRRKGLAALLSWPVQPWLHTAKARAKVVAAWRATDPMNDWLDLYVGPSVLPPDDAER